ncbi:TetR family transcriptional regulator [Nocardia mangyaensis]|uniref:TetR family transcriptional regulator n=1 Tax=Nocardia mangyaensis TaxID=2213200 RepID=A0A1J0VSA4_9NOCA|nr:TetR family transcriptional regulator [Nocardia mangyaensis]
MLTGVARTEGTRAPGRPAAASRDDVLDAAIHTFLAGRRVDANAIAAQLGLGRTSIYRWFGSRDGLLGAALARQLEQMVGYAERRSTATGGERLVEVLDLAVHWLVDNGSLRTYFDQESTAALRLITRSDGVVHPAAVAIVEGLLERAEEQGYRPPIDRATLAYALVRLWEAFLYNDAVAGFQGDVERLSRVQAALLRA